LAMTGVSTSRDAVLSRGDMPAQYTCGALRATLVPNRKAAHARARSEAR
jgi:hypothetical protein